MGKEHYIVYTVEYKVWGEIYGLPVYFFTTENKGEAKLENAKILLWMLTPLKKNYNYTSGLFS